MKRQRRSHMSLVVQCAVSVVRLESASDSSKDRATSAPRAWSKTNACAPMPSFFKKKKKKKIGLVSLAPYTHSFTSGVPDANLSKQRPGRIATLLCPFEWAKETKDRANGRDGCEWILFNAACAPCSPPPSFLWDAPEAKEPAWR